MIRLPESAAADRIRTYFADASYTEEGVNEVLGTHSLVERQTQDLSTLLDRTGSPGRLNTLIRWFLLCVPVSLQQAEATVTDQIRQDLLDCGLLRAEDDVLSSRTMVTPFRDLLLCSDPVDRLTSDDAFDVVLPMNPVSFHLSNFMVPNAVDSALDLCCGCGVHALLTARHCRHVVATDLNERAVQFTQFNARLNGLENVECLVGDRFEPVADRTFDLILTNPPFVLSPETAFLYRDSQMPVDAFCRQLIEEVGGYLKDGGLLQMTFEWAEVEGQPWEERIGEWIAQAGCDGWLLHANRQLPESYARGRIDETLMLPEERPAELERWLEYYNAENIRAIHGGMIAVRHRSGKNWLRIDRLTETPDETLGHVVPVIFANRDLLEESDDDILQTALRPTPGLHLLQERRLESGQWQTVTSQLRAPGGATQTVTVDDGVVTFISRLDGRQTVADLLPSLGMPAEDPDEFRAMITRIVRGLMEHAILQAASE